MKWRQWTEYILHFLPFWFFGLGLISPIMSGVIEWGLTYSPNPKLLYDFQDSFLGRNEMFGTFTLISFGLSWIWSFLIHLFWRGKDRPTRWSMAILYLVFPIIAAMMISAVLPHRPSRKRVERYKRVQCRSNMKQIVMALWMYANDNGDHYPDKLEMLVPDYLSDKKLFRCPSAKGDHGVCNYHYYGKGRKSTDPIFLILEDKTENHRGNYKNQARSDGYCGMAKKIR